MLALSPLWALGCSPRPTVAVTYHRVDMAADLAQPAPPATAFRRAVPVPRLIWFCWLQGLHRAPYVVRRCHESWAVRNPGWELRVVDRDEAESLTGLTLSSGSLRRLAAGHQSDLVRLALLSSEGGVWADATCFCAEPLESWLWPVLTSGFFAFARPGRDRVLASWFLAAAPGHLLVTRLYEALLDHWLSHRYRNHEVRSMHSRLRRVIETSPERTLLWFWEDIRDRLQLSPYYALHYLFHQLIVEDPRCAQAWAETPKVGAGRPHALATRGLTRDAGPLREKIDAGWAPLYKLDWRVDEASITPESSIGYLFDRHALAGRPAAGGP